MKHTHTDTHACMHARTHRHVHIFQLKSKYAILVFPSPHPHAPFNSLISVRLLLFFEHTHISVTLSIALQHIGYYAVHGEI